MDTNDESIDLMVSMGFDRNLSRQALSFFGNVDLAIDGILSGQVTAESQHAATNDAISNSINDNNMVHPVRIIDTDLSQYSLPDGRSACTAFALHTVSVVLQKITNTKEINFISSTDLNSFLIDGVAFYKQLISKRGSIDPNVEHSSAEELLSMIPDKLGLTLIGGVRQGILTKNNMENPLGFCKILEDCRLEGNGSNWMGVVITKTPESVCIFLPPKEEDSNLNEYAIIDSHSRPSHDGCHALFYNSKEGVLSRLGDIFPAVELGSDVPEIMAAMYNSFDAYAFQTS